MKHEALLESEHLFRTHPESVTTLNDLAGLGAGSTPYSKSHAKRVKRKAKEELTADLAAVGEAIAAVDAQDSSSHAQQRSDKDPAQKLKPRPGQIGEGKGGSLTKNQRKRTL